MVANAMQKIEPAEAPTASAGGVSTEFRAESSAESSAEPRAESRTELRSDGAPTADASTLQLHVTAADRFPPKYVDVVELMFRQLTRRGVVQTWYCQGLGTGESAPLSIDDSKPRVRVIGSPVFARFGMLGRLATKLCYWGLDTILLLRLLFQPVDMILVRDKYWASLVALLVSRIRRVPFMIWMSYPFPDDDLERSASFKGLMRPMLWLSGQWGRFVYYGIAMRRADHVFVQSEQMKREMGERGIALDRMTAVPMGVMRSMIEAGEHPGVPSSPPVVLYLGGLQVVRRLEVMIDSFAEIAKARPDVRFAIVGSGSIPEDTERLVRRAEQHGIRDRIDFTGQLPIDIAMKHVERAAVCLSPIIATPTLRVASPTKFVEYLALGKPAVGNHHPEQTMIAEQSQGALCVEWEPKAFADATLWCLDHPEEARQMALRGRAWVRANRSYETLGQLVHGRMLEVRDEVLQRRGAR